MSSRSAYASGEARRSCKSRKRNQVQRNKWLLQSCSVMSFELTISAKGVCEVSCLYLVSRRFLYMSLMSYPPADADPGVIALVTRHLCIRSESFLVLSRTFEKGSALGLWPRAARGRTGVPDPDSASAMPTRRRVQ